MTLTGGVTVTVAKIPAPGSTPPGGSGTSGGSNGSTNGGTNGGTSGGTSGGSNGDGYLRPGDVPPLWPNNPIGNPPPVPEGTKIYNPIVIDPNIIPIVVTATVGIGIGVGVAIFAPELIPALITGGARASGLLLPLLLPSAAGAKSWDHANETCPPVDPIMLDLNNDGVISTTSVQNGIQFDMNANGFAEQTAWVGSGDGILAYDKNGDGFINDGSELLGNETILSNDQKADNGIQALADLDSNGDGKIDTNDAAYSNLLVLKGDGMYSTLSELGITSLNYSNWTSANNADANGNTETIISSYTKSDGSTAKMSDYSLETNQTSSIATQWLTVPDDILQLPDAVGYGNTYYLSQAMVRDTSGTLKTLVESFVNENNPTNRSNILDQILYQWTNSENVVPNSRGDVDARQLAVLESFSGETFKNNPTSQVDQYSAPYVDYAYNSLKEQVYAELMCQSHLNELFSSAFNLVTQSDGSTLVTLDLTSDATKIENDIQTNPVSGKQELGEFVRTLYGLGLANNDAYNNFYNSISSTLGSDYQTFMDSYNKNVINGTTGSDSLTGTAGDDYITGNGGNDTIMSGYGDDKVIAGSGNDLIDACYGNDNINGGAGNDTLFGRFGDDTLIGGTGNDLLQGGDNNDTYIFNLGDGNDTIYDTDWSGVHTGGSNDRIVFGAGITQSDLSFKAFEDNLIISYGNQGDVITIQQGLDANNQIESIQFADGSTLSYAQMLALIPDIQGTSGNDSITGSILSEKIFGGDGNDTIIGYGGNDTITGGKGNDYLRGCRDNDTYIFNLGDGNDTIFDADYSGYFGGGSNDKIIFGTGITQSNLSFKASGSDLIITYGNQGDQIIVQGGLTGNNQIENIQFADGSLLSYSQMISEIPVITGTSGNDTINGSFLKDTIQGGTGNDLLMGDIGNDTYIFNVGDGQDTIHDLNSGSYNWYDAGNDKIVFGNGITQNNLVVTAIGNDVQINFKDANGNITSDSIYIQEQLLDKNKIETFQFADGSSLTSDQIIQLSSEIQGTGGNDTLNGSTLNDTIFGNAGNDNIYGNAGNDIISGGTGNDYLNGGLGDDTYIFNVGDGQDIIADNADQYYYNGGNDKIVFGTGITASNLVFTPVGGENGDVIIGIKDANGNLTTDSITIRGQLINNTKIETLQFADGSTLSYQDIINNLTAIKAPDNNGDNVSGSIANDTIYGGTGNDYISGNEGDDTLIGGKGNDYLSGGTGNDTYVFNAGDGRDAIADYSIYGGDPNDNITFGAGISQNNLIFAKDPSSPNNLLIYFKDANGNLTSDKITIVDQAVAQGQIESFKFADGTTLTAVQAQSLATTTSYDANSFYGSTITGTSGNDIINGGSANDSLSGGTGNDTYVFNAGGGQDTINDNGGGTDTLVLGNGITQNKTHFAKSNNDLLITFDNSQDKILVQNQFNTPNSLIENFQFSDGSSLSYNDVNNLLATIKGTSGNDNLVGTSGIDTIYGYAGDDTINSYDGNDYIDGGDGNDSIVAGSGDDTIIAGKGNDSITTVGGNDTYLFNTSDGKDTILDSLCYTNQSYNDTIQFGAGITQNNVSFKASGNDLIINFTDSNGNLTTDSITIQSGLASSGYFKIENYKFSDGTSLAYSDVIRILSTINGTSGNDNLVGTSNNDTIYGYAGNDTINSNDGNDYIDAGAGNDSIISGSGNSTIIGGTGNDYMDGSLGNDTYIFNSGDGQDTIADNAGQNYYNGGNDTLQFGASITKNNLSLKSNGSDLIINFTDSNGNPTTDQITIRNDLTASGNTSIENFKFSDGTSLAYSDIIKLIPAINGTAGNDVLNGSAIGDTIYGNAGNDTINSNDGNDYIDAGAGNDSIISGSGNSTIIGGTGNDYIDGGMGNDTYIFNTGDGQDTIADNASQYYYNGGNDTLQFGVGITKNNLSVKGNGNDLIINFTDSNGNPTTDQITISGDLTSSGYTSIENYTFADGTSLAYSDIMKLIPPIYGTAGNDVLNGSAIDDTIYGNAGNDTINSYDGNDYIDAGDGNDSIISGNGNSTIIGGTGNDYMDGGMGNDTYIFNTGDGQDTIYDNGAQYYYNGGNDTLKFGADITQSNLLFAKDPANSNLVVYFKDNNGNLTSDKITIINQFSSNNAIENFTFNDGTSLTSTQVTALAQTNSYNGTSSNDNLVGSSGNDIINALAGNDTLTGNAGNDILNGGDGDDTYIFNTGDGQDAINDTSGNDTVKFNSGITESSIAIFKQGNDLLLSYDNNGDTVTLKNQSTTGTIEKVQLSDGKYLTSADMNVVLQNMSSFASSNNIQLTGINDVRNNQQLMNLVANSWHN